MRIEHAPAGRTCSLYGQILHDHFAEHSPLCHPRNKKQSRTSINDHASALQSWAGSAACWVAGWLASSAFILAFRAQGYLLANTSAPLILGRLLAVSACSAAVEALPIPEIDNLTISLAAASSAALLF